MVIESINFQNTYDSSSYFFRDKDFKNAFKYFLFSKKYLLEAGTHFAFETYFHYLKICFYYSQSIFGKYSTSFGYFLALLKIIFARAELFDNYYAVYFI